MGLLDKREVFKPFEYPELEDMAKGIQQTYWIHNEIDFSADVHQFRIELTDKERYIIGTILKSFAVTEVYVYDEFWGKIGNYLPKPEVHLVAATFAENEWRHAMAYQRLNEVLGLEDYAAFMEDPVLVARSENLTSLGEIKSPRDIMRVLAIFGGFTEYVNLFSQFAVLKSFSCNGKNLLPNISNIVDWSAIDEDLHSKTAMHLFNTLKREYPQYWTEESKTDIYLAARNTFDIEVNLINQIFELGDLDNLTKDELLNFMKNRINESLNQMGLGNIFDVDVDLLKNMDWFLLDVFADQQTDFFAKRPTAYTKFNKIFDANSIKVTKDEIKSI